MQTVADLVIKCEGPIVYGFTNTKCSFFATSYSLRNLQIQCQQVAIVLNKTIVNRWKLFLKICLGRAASYA